MKKEELFRELGNIDEKLVEDAFDAHQKRPRRAYVRIAALAAAVCILVCSSVSVLAYYYVQGRDTELYFRYLSQENVNLQDDEDAFDAEPFLRALKKDDTRYQYIAINRLVECYSDAALRKKAIRAIEPFRQSGEKQVAEAANLALDILSERFQSKYVYKMADGSVFFTLFHKESEGGSYYRELWQIKNGVLEKYFSFDSPSKNISAILPSPDRKRLAIQISTNKSTYLAVLNPMEDNISKELVESTRILYGAKRGYTVLERIDHENYCMVPQMKWKDANTLSFDAELAYNDMEIVENVSVTYHVDTATYDVISTK